MGEVGTLLQGKGNRDTFTLLSALTFCCSFTGQAC